MLIILKDKAEDEMEFDIDAIPDDALHEMLKIIRKHLPPLSHDEPEAAPTAAVHQQQSMRKTKKNKPMSSREQEHQISALKGQIANFKKDRQGQIPFSDTKEESSGDESDSNSESEEE